jgi:hypothetical protein
MDDDKAANRPEEEVTFNRLFLEGRARLVNPALEADCERAYWASRTLGMTDEQVMAYLEENNAERGKAHLIDPALYGRERLH